MSHACVGFLELATIAKGIQVIDALLKKATVDIVFAYPISSGRYLCCFTGEVEEVRSALAQGKKTAQAALYDMFFLANMHPDIIPTLRSKIKVSEVEAIGILETATCAKSLLAADAALKTSKVRLLKIKLGKGIGGKGYFILEGEIGEVEAAMLSAIRIIKKEGIIEQIIIPQVTPELLEIF